MKFSETIMSGKKIKVGVDFDGVLAYNPLRVARAPAVLLKKILGINGGRKFYVPKTRIEKILFWLPHELSFFPALGTSLLKDLVEGGEIEAHIISGRYGYLRPSLDRWIRSKKIEHIFSSVHTNLNNEQPHLYKERVITKLGLDYYIEDNYDIVEHLNKRVKSRILWIYNLIDKNKSYKDKYPYLKSALGRIVDSQKPEKK